MDSFDQEFLKQLGGSGAANALTLMAIGVFLLLKRTNCNHKKSKCKSLCFSMEYDDKTLRSNNTNGQKQKSDESESESDDEEGLPKLHRKHRKRLGAESV